MSDIIQSTNEMAKQSDRWLFVFLLVVLILSFGFFMRWLLKDREVIAKRLTEVTDRHIEVTEDLSKVVTNNTAVLERVEKKL